MTNNTPRVLISIAKVPNQKVAKQPKCFSFFFLFFRQASSNLCDSFTMVFAQSSSIFHSAVHQPIAFLQVRSHMRFEPLTEELRLPLRCHFSSCVRMHTNHLAMKCILLRKIAELETLLVCRECLKKACDSSVNHCSSTFDLYTLCKPPSI